ncbi:MAG: DUF2513 domain-containing protein [Ruminococcus sp.]|nr:DUF2513 domain-containing protein [Ruminococcus sp.]
MKLNYDCVRDVLLTIEEITGLDDSLLFEPVCFYDIASNLSQYDDKETLYTILKLSEAEYIKTKWMNEKQENFHDYMVFDITFKGHEYLNSIRNPKVWNTIKNGAVALSMSLIPKLAETFVLNHLNFLK